MSGGPTPLRPIDEAATDEEVLSTDSTVLRERSLDGEEPVTDDRAVASANRVTPGTPTGSGSTPGTGSTPAPPSPLARYGGSPLWAGIGSRGSDIRRLQADLWNLGFWFTEMIASAHRRAYSFEPGKQSALATSHATGVFDAQTEWAVREFQIYAGMETIARRTGGTADRYVDNLRAVPNSEQYSGEITGVVDEETATALGHWRDEKWRCPVIVEAYSSPGKLVHVAHTNPGKIQADRSILTDKLEAQNIWSKRDVRSSGPRMFVTDFTGYYEGFHRSLYGTSLSAHDVDIPANINGVGKPAIVAGWYNPGNQGGPVSKPSTGNTWPNAEVLPKHLLGKPLSAILGDADTLSTYKLVRASAEVECEGFFDGITAYDNALESVGPCHWTLTTGNQSTAGAARLNKGELAGYLAYLRSTDATAYHNAFGRFGVEPPSWGANGATLFMSQRKFTGRLTAHYQTGSGPTTASTEIRARDKNYFRSWHWFYRFLMAGRVIQSYRRRMWDAARMRLRDLASTPWPSTGNEPTVGSGGSARPAKLGEVFTSERALGMILRWHIKSPGHVTSGHRVGSKLQDALADAKTRGAALTWSGDPTTDWGDAHEEHLIEGIARQVASRPKLAATMQRVRTWPSWIPWQRRKFTLNRTAIKNQLPPAAQPSGLSELLSPARGSFVLDTNGIPTPFP